ncbi:peptidase S10, serine carboxypeptidase, partial [Ascoidea rubescens DSM 1968]
QPIGTGYSFSNTASTIKSTDLAAVDVYKFLKLFFEKYPNFQKNNFHLAGESYAGHYIPRIASEILKHNDKSFQLSSIIIGNGITDPLTQFEYYQPMVCGEGDISESILSSSQCKSMKKYHSPVCKKLIQGCYKTSSALICVPAAVYCASRLIQPIQQSGKSIYDLRTAYDYSAPLGYTHLLKIEEYLNQEFVKNALGINEKGYSSDYVTCSSTVSSAFDLSGDHLKPFQQYVAEVLNNDIPVLIYAGDKDFMCNWLGNEAWTSELNYKNHKKYKKVDFKDYITLENQHAGYIKNYDKFTFIRMFDAGHMVPHDQPKNSLDMINRWLNGDYSYSS